MRDNERELITIAQAAVLRNVERQTMYAAVEKGNPEVVEIAGRKILRVADVLAYVPSKGGKPPSAEKEPAVKRARKAKARK